MDSIDSSTSSYKIELPFYEGPMDLLLHLIKKNEIDIYDIPIALVTEQYLEYIEMLKVLNLDTIGDFLVMAATLMHIKSKMLLPPDPEEDAEEADPREELVKRLIEYRKFRDAAEKLSGREQYYSELYDRDASIEGLKKEEILLEVSVFDLISAFRSIIVRVKDKEFHEVTIEKLNINDKISDIMEKLNSNKSLTLQQFFENMGSRYEMVITFLALLELIKLRLVKVVQKNPFSTIEIYSN
ncbi:MAG: hypothetical protein A3C43_10075 [Candidatus Schekmanbacteria bacterium RIFCSPHIGHO2_02_FULL_38_11]|uniref:Segregation and condensation protein A n=1 Tax=Candidatus Schekmanbacteria bacterium RIFCSPLOWO2_12_FULL_38_15 TaxID=1817883 RepID=A0A1F7SL08_9BACT|nr:MAG: hypothetical protein A2043_05675 [Candidatus Schekmanbacteria bacterium GWA2_38_9]OGL48043.1 MAG: hypothetical protein A3H37_08465 [Candidatus Schekmanbacteria bacterium RIFCSPLOWO2_02_FULL_38_14]OGL50707.1 MAG: hypothetical protein A3C43_10075 [Candidatus Schekmanbacteria bacterium RIFCSPHIGHO2_02_FULL_38_11]OGL54472.1 MAG: hypothetical protein A3G31_09925 [Candidatus Schekmanbacteria bacterium RIFCSPLOWO2_12_FULL_38_15]